MKHLIASLLVALSVGCAGQAVEPAEPTCVEMSVCDNGGCWTQSCEPTADVVMSLAEGDKWPLHGNICADFPVGQFLQYRYAGSVDYVQWFYCH